MTPLTALALFSGVHLRTRQGLTLLLIALVLGDIFLGWHSLVPITWGSFVLVFFLSRWLNVGKFPRRALGGSLAGSTIFFLVTNLAVFFFTPLYPRSWTGILECYTAALPFYRNALLGDLLYTGIIFGLHQLVVSRRVPVEIR